MRLYIRFIFTSYSIPIQFLHNSYSIQFLFSSIPIQLNSYTIPIQFNSYLIQLLFTPVPGRDSFSNRGWVCSTVATVLALLVNVACSIPGSADIFFRDLSLESDAKPTQFQFSPQTGVLLFRLHMSYFVRGLAICFFKEKLEGILIDSNSK